MGKDNTTPIDEALTITASQVFGTKPYKHDPNQTDGESYILCTKCHKTMLDVEEAKWTEVSKIPCEIPDRLDVTDWNVAYELRWLTWNATGVDICISMEIAQGIKLKPQDYIMRACEAMGRNSNANQG